MSHLINMLMILILQTENVREANAKGYNGTGTNIMPLLVIRITDSVLVILLR